MTPPDSACSIKSTGSNGKRSLTRTKASPSSQRLAGKVPKGLRYRKGSAAGRMLMIDSMWRAYGPPADPPQITYSPTRSSVSSIIFPLWSQPSRRSPTTTSPQRQPHQPLSLPRSSMTVLSHCPASHSFVICQGIFLLCVFLSFA